MNATKCFVFSSGGHWVFFRNSLVPETSKGPQLQRAGQCSVLHEQTPWENPDTNFNSCEINMWQHLTSYVNTDRLGSHFYLHQKKGNKLALKWCHSKSRTNVRCYKMLIFTDVISCWTRTLGEFIDRNKQRSGRHRMSAASMAACAALWTAASLMSCHLHRCRMHEDQTHSDHTAHPDLQYFPYILHSGRSSSLSASRSVPKTLCT